MHFSQMLKTIYISSTNFVEKLIDGNCKMAVYLLFTVKITKINNNVLILLKHEYRYSNYHLMSHVFGYLDLRFGFLIKDFLLKKTTHCKMAFPLKKIFFYTIGDT